MAGLTALAGIVMTAALGAWALDAARITEAVSDEALWLPQIAPGLGLPESALCGLVLAGMELLNDDNADLRHRRPGRGASEPGRDRSPATSCGPDDQIAEPVAIASPPPREPPARCPARCGGSSWVRRGTSRASAPTTR